MYTEAVRRYNVELLVRKKVYFFLGWEGKKEFKGEESEKISSWKFLDNE